MRILDIFFQKLLYPIRIAIRFELQRELEKERKLSRQYINAGLDTVSRSVVSSLTKELLSVQNIQNLQLATQREATANTARFVMEYMPKVRAFNSQEELMEYAISAANLTESSIICEFGVWSGKSISHIASRVRNQIYGFDSFEGLPEDWRTGFEAGHFAKTELPAVPANVKLIKGLFQDTLFDFLSNVRNNIGLIHIDCDLYSSTSVVLNVLAPRIGPGCIIVFDEYFNFPGWEVGEYSAFKEYIEKSGRTFRYIAYNDKHEQVAVRME